MTKTDIEELYNEDIRLRKLRIDKFMDLNVEVRTKVAITFQSFLSHSGRECILDFMLELGSRDMIEDSLY